jgi:hypothetical protein
MRFIKKSLWAFSVAFVMMHFISCQQNIQSTQNKQTSFAIVTDSITYEKVQSQILSYKKMLEQEGLKVSILKDEWGEPREIRNLLKDMYHSDPQLEGAVFVGDVPIPMIMDAQHLTTAYKRNQKSYPLHIAAVPSDRYYDDFDLTFEYMEADTAHPLNYYYRLKADSPHYVDSDIYTARIKPSVGEKDNKYRIIGRYLDQVVALREKDYNLNDVLSFTGHGYNSESLTAWAGEKLALREHFPNAFNSQGDVDFLEFRMDDFMKTYLLSKLQNDDLDVALLHEHGAPDMQYLSGYPYVSSVSQSIENVKRYLRSKLRSAERRGNDLEQTKQRYIEHYDVPYKWFDDTFSEENTYKDSVFNRKLDVYLKDIEEITPRAKFIMFDACFNGAFNHDQYVAGEYVFGDGNTIVAHANTVNALQDKWPNEMIGLLSTGVRVGNWAKEINTLETHLIGDPTFHFDNSHDEVDYNQVIAAGASNKSIWKEVLEKEHPDLKALALNNLFDYSNKAFAAQLKDIFKNSPHMVVRMECLHLLRQYNGPHYHEVLKMAVDDPYELIRRKATSYMGKAGNDAFIPSVLKIPYHDRYSKRVVYGAYNSLDFFDPEKVSQQIDEVGPRYSYHLNSSKLTENLKERVANTRQKVEESYGYLKSDTIPLRYRKLEIRILRNYHYHHMVPKYLSLIKSPDFKEELKVMLIEALGWFTHSYQKDAIEATCREIIEDDSSSEKVKREARRTLNRLNPYEDAADTNEA